MEFCRFWQYSCLSITLKLAHLKCTLIRYFSLVNLAVLFYLLYQIAGLPVGTLLLAFAPGLYYSFQNTKVKLS